MKKILIALTLFLGTTINIYANSGPPKLTYVGGTEMLAVDHDTPISVLEEHLFFEMPVDEPDRYDARYRATATYTMVNESEEHQTVPMVFPYSANLDTYSREDVAVYVNGETVNFETYIGKKDKTSEYPVDEALAFDFEDALAAINREGYTSSTLNRQTKGIHYIIRPQEGVVEEGKSPVLATYIELEPEGTKVIAFGNHDSDYTSRGLTLRGYTVFDEYLHLFA